LFARHHRTGAIKQLEQDAQRLLRQARSAAVSRDFSRNAVHRPAVELQRALLHGSIIKK
jgi:hypothetical protein